MILDKNSPLFGAQVRILESSKSVLSETPSFAHKSFVQWKGASEENPCLTPFFLFAESHCNHDETYYEQDRCTCEVVDTVVEVRDVPLFRLCSFF